MQTAFLPRAAALALIAAALAGCETQLDIDLTSGSIDEIDEVVLQINAIELRREDGSTRKIELDPTADPDLLDYRDGELFSLVGGEDVGTGSYNGVRLLYDSDGSTLHRSEDDAGEDIDIEVPSSPAYAEVDFSLGEDDQEQLVIELDPRFSLIDRTDAGSNDYQLQPVLRAAIASTTGSIGGRIDDSLVTGNACRRDGRAIGEGVAIYVYEGTITTPFDFVSSASNRPIAAARLRGSANNYRYEIGLLAPGDYTVALTCDADRDAPLTDEDQTATVVFRVTETATVEEGEQADTPLED